jgi:AcrR family transcriptional regulator
MPRTPAPGRLENIGDVALAVFSDLGFRRAQMSDIAKAAGVAQGTLYLYAKSKEALFWLALQRSLGEELGGMPQEQELLDLISNKLGFAILVPSLFEHEQGRSAPLEQAVSETWNAIETYAPAIRLVERCAWDWPELAALFYTELRPRLLQRITDYLQFGIEKGFIRKMPDVSLAARLIVETISWFAIHRHGDADGKFFDPNAAKTATVDALVHAYSASQNQ